MIIFLLNVNKLSFYKNYKFNLIILFIFIYFTIIYKINKNKINENIQKNKQKDNDINQVNQENQEEDKNSLYSNTIYYRGEKILKNTLINNYLSRISDDFKSAKDDEKERFYQYYNLTDYSNNMKKQDELRDKLLQELSRLKNQTISKIDIFFISFSLNFGNSLVAINNAIFYCEVIRCNKIILNSLNSKRRWLLRNPINIEKLNITIIQDFNINCSDNNIFCFYESSWDIFFPKIIFSQLRTDLIKKEILRNLPEVNIEKDSLYIHIRSGDIFQEVPHGYYAQPPLCFYESIINNNKFSNIYIVSMDNSNIILDVLTNKYPNIVYKNNTLEYDISLLCHAFNLAISASSFALSAIKLNENLVNVWEFDIIRLSEKLLFLHHHIFKLSRQFKIHTMQPSDNYLSKMFSWKRSYEQIKLMLEDNCPFDFINEKQNK